MELRLQRPVAVRCDGCGRKYRFESREAMNGVRCRYCGAYIKRDPGDRPGELARSAPARYQAAKARAEARAEAYHVARALRHGGDKPEQRRHRAMEMRFEARHERRSGR